MNALTLEVILRVVFGVTDESRLAALRPLARRLNAIAADYTAKRYHQQDDEWSPDWNLTGLVQDGQLLHRLGRSLRAARGQPGQAFRDRGRRVARQWPRSAAPHRDDMAARMHGWKCESATFRMNVALSDLPSFTAKPGKGDHLTGGIIIAPVVHLGVGAVVRGLVVARDGVEREQDAQENEEQLGHGRDYDPGSGAGRI